MPRKTKAGAEEKAQIVEAYLRGEMGLAKVAKNLCRFTAGGRPTLTEQM